MNWIRKMLRLTDWKERAGYWRMMYAEAMIAWEFEIKNRQKRVAELEGELATVRRDFASTAVRLTDVECQLYDLRHAAKTPKQRLVIENQQLAEELGRLSGKLTAAVDAGEEEGEDV